MRSFPGFSGLGTSGLPPRLSGSEGRLWSACSSDRMLGCLSIIPISRAVTQGGSGSAGGSFSLVAEVPAPAEAEELAPSAPLSAPRRRRARLRETNHRRQSTRGKWNGGQVVHGHSRKRLGRHVWFGLHRHRTDRHSAASNGAGADDAAVEDRPGPTAATAAASSTSISSRTVVMVANSP